ncbi:hypothetical protein ACJJTC_000669 [Scirpophaga incertulas]
MSSEKLIRYSYSSNLSYKNEMKTDSILQIVKTELNCNVIDIEDQIAQCDKNAAEIPKLKQDLVSAKSSILALELELEQRDQLARMNNVEISGIPVSTGENVITLLRDISNKVGYSLDDRDIDGVMRVRRSGKDQFLAAVSSRRGLTTTDINVSGPLHNIYVSDHLSPRNKLLLKRARQAKADMGYSYLWVRDCKILMRRNDKSKAIVIKNDEDITKLT